MRILYRVLTAFVALVLGGLAFIYSGVYNVTAMEEHSDLGRWALHTTMKHSVEARATDLDSPPDLTSDAMVRRGARAYDQLCAACHLKPGLDSTLLRQGLNPTPPSLAEGGHFGPAEQFWVIKNGIKMSGMPAWGVTHDDETLWEITAFLQRLPGLSETEYEGLIQAEPDLLAETDDGHDHDHGTMAGMMASEAGDHHDAQNKQTTGDNTADDHYADGHTH